jgi:hypothetical protein
VHRALERCIWHNLPMGPRGRHPDFVIVHPANGLLVLEVKDWRLDTIVSANKSSATGCSCIRRASGRASSCIPTQ